MNVQDIFAQEIFKSTDELTVPKDFNLKFNGFEYKLLQKRSGATEVSINDLVDAFNETMKQYDNLTNNDGIQLVQQLVLYTNKLFAEKHLKNVEVVEDEREQEYIVPLPDLTYLTQRGSVYDDVIFKTNDFDGNLLFNVKAFDIKKPVTDDLLFTEDELSLLPEDYAKEAVPADNFILEQHEKYDALVNQDKTTEDDVPTNEYGDLDTSTDVDVSTDKDENDEDRDIEVADIFKTKVAEPKEQKADDEPKSKDKGLISDDGTRLTARGLRRFKELKNDSETKNMKKSLRPLVDKLDNFDFEILALGAKTFKELSEILSMDPGTISKYIKASNHENVKKHFNV